MTRPTIVRHLIEYVTGVRELTDEEMFETLRYLYDRYDMEASLWNDEEDIKNAQL